MDMLDQSKLHEFRRLECAMSFLPQDERDVVKVPRVVSDLCNRGTTPGR